ncbi:acid protease [Delitschia confertaspora ATCC 74209]|uniref:receptor protein-tyrosine kinase n=1 Tax=Delitschia confertaspora ATCC 74209 TaxID=1513339 RepID=A0A9P4MUD0_9PLEO|nr:acid protease [Delitschia confertaspora ATCC 74209]
MSPHKRAEKAIKAPVVVTPATTWDGNDGKWSTFFITVGDDGLGRTGQDFRVLISTSSSITQIPVEADWCTQPDQEKCADRRGVQMFQAKQSLGFQVNVASNWKQLGPYTLPVPPYFDDYPEKNPGGSYGTVTVGFGRASSAPLSMPGQMVAQINTKDFFMGSFGLSAIPASFGGKAMATFLQNFANNSLIPSLSYGYTAGAYYRNNNGVVGNLVLGGYDHSRFTDLGVSIFMPSNLSLVVGVQYVGYRNTDVVDYSFTQSSKSFTTGFYATIDSTLPYLWLPDEICDQFAEKFHLQWDSDQKLYTVNDAAHDQNIKENAFVSFRIGKNAQASNDNNFTSITLPYAAFDLTAEWPLVNETTKYFPLKRSPTQQYVLGRAFLQEAYLIVDYDHKNFTVAPANFSDPMPEPHIVAVLSGTEPPKSEDPGLSSGAIAGIVVGVVIGVLILLAAAFLYWRRRRQARQRERTMLEKPSEVDTILAGGEVKHRRVSELDSNLPGSPHSPQGSSVDGYYGHQHKDVIPFPPINEYPAEMESPPEIAELESPPLEQAQLADASPRAPGPHAVVAEYFDDRLKRRGATRDRVQEGDRAPTGPTDERGDQTPTGPTHNRGASDVTVASNIDIVISNPSPIEPEPRSAGGHSAHARGPSDATVQSGVSDPTSEQLEDWRRSRGEPRRPLSE